MRGKGLQRLLEDLAAGDPLAWGFVGLFVVVGLGIGLFAVKIHFAHKREDEASARRYGRSKWPR